MLLLTLGAIGVEAGLSYGHALQAAGKRDLPAEQLMHFQTRVLGPHHLGAGALEAGALLSAAAATWTARYDRAIAWRSATSLLSTGTAFAVWAKAIQPINQRLSTWHSEMHPEDVPGDWAVLRDRWHRLHVARLALLTVGAAAAGSAANQQLRRTSTRMR